MPKEEWRKNGERMKKECSWGVNGMHNFTCLAVSSFVARSAAAANPSITEISTCSSIVTRMRFTSVYSCMNEQHDQEEQNATTVMLIINKNS